MPLVTLTVRKPKPAAANTPILDSGHAAPAAPGVPVTDRRLHA